MRRVRNLDTRTVKGSATAPTRLNAGRCSHVRAPEDPGAANFRASWLRTTSNSFTTTHYDLARDFHVCSPFFSYHKR